MHERALVRFAGPEDLEWCVVEDGLVVEKIMRNKIVNDEIIVVEIDGQLIGYIRLEYLWTTIPYIGMFFVINEYRRSGIGRKMQDFLEEHLRSQGYEIVLSSSHVNDSEPQAWYRSIGFEECGILSGLNESGIGEIFFKKRLV